MVLKRQVSSVYREFIKNYSYHQSAFVTKGYQGAAETLSYNHTERQAERQAVAS